MPLKLLPVRFELFIREIVGIFRIPEVLVGASDDGLEVLGTVQVTVDLDHGAEVVTGHGVEGRVDGGFAVALEIVLFHGPS